MEVRAANLANCRGAVETLLGGGHKACVARRAAHSVALIKQVPPHLAQQAVQQVFTRSPLLLTTLVSSPLHSPAGSVSDPRVFCPDLGSDNFCNVDSVFKVFFVFF